TLHPSMAAAENNTDVLSLPLFITTVAGQQTVYFRVIETGSTTNCASVAPVVLTVNPVPVIPLLPDLVECENPTPPAPDGIEVFDLTSQEALITGGNADIAVAFFVS